MMKEFVDDFMHLLLRFFPYLVAIKIKDGIVMMSAFFAGIVATLFIIAYLWVYHRVRWRDFDADDNVVAVRFTKGGRNATYIDPPKSILGVFNVWLAFLVLRFSKRDSISVIDLKKIKRLIILIAVIDIILSIIALCFILTPEMPKGFDGH